MSDAALLTVTIPPEGLELIRFAQTFLATAEAVTITTPEEAQGVVDQAKRAKDCRDELTEYRMGFTRPLDEQKKAYIEAFRPADESLERAEKLLKGAYAVWDAEQKRLAAEQEKIRRAAEAEDRKRQEAEQARAAELLRQADEAADRGDLAAAEALETQAAAVQVVAIPVAQAVATSAPKTRGASNRTIWKCRVVEPSKLDRAYLMPNQVMLDALAATAKGVGAAPEGCEWVSSSSVSLR